MLSFMTTRHLPLLLAVAPCLTLAQNAPAAFTAKQQEQIGKIAVEYLMAHPELLDRLEQARQAQLSNRNEAEVNTLVKNVISHQSALLEKNNTPQVGPPDAAVAVIEFYDYQCSFCSKAAPYVQQTIDAQPQVRFIFKDWPYLAQRWPTSETAAAVGIAIWQAKGPQAFFTYHQGLFNTGHIDGQLQLEDIAHVLKTIQATVPTPQATTKARVILKKNVQLTARLGLKSAPTFIVMPTRNATPDNTSVFLGAVSAETLQAAILKASQ